jgi:hypothetical protein
MDRPAALRATPFQIACRKSWPWPPWPPFPLLNNSSLLSALIFIQRSAFLSLCVLTAIRTLFLFQSDADLGRRFQVRMDRWKPFLVRLDESSAGHPDTRLSSPIYWLPGSRTWASNCRPARGRARRSPRGPYPAGTMQAKNAATTWLRRQTGTMTLPRRAGFHLVERIKHSSSHRRSNSLSTKDSSSDRPA